MPYKACVYKGIDLKMTTQCKEHGSKDHVLYVHHGDDFIVDWIFSNFSAYIRDHSYGISIRGIFHTYISIIIWTITRQ